MKRILILLALCSSLLTRPVLALTQDDVLTAALLPGYQTETGQMAGLRLTLTPGWKTYWRTPGEAGIPPVFDWSGSENVKSVRVHWPAPSVFHTNGMQAIGYHDQVLLPLEVTAKDPSKPMRLAGGMELGVCKDICMPARLDLSADLITTSHAAAIKSALRALPDRLGTVAHCEVALSKHGLDITATLAVARLGADEVLAIETADPSYWVGPAVLTRTKGRLTATATIYTPAGAATAFDRSGITLTLLAEGRAVEIKGCPAP